MVKMNLSVDIHLHSTHSCDAKSTIDEMCQTAVERGLQVICFTEHIDWNPHDNGLNYYRYDVHTRDICIAQEKFAGQLQVLQGIEFSEPHVYPKEFEQLIKKGFDFVLGSVHYLGDSWVGGKEMLENWPVERAYELYYREVLKAVLFGGFDSLAHIDFPKRYLGAKVEPVSLIEEILRELVRKQIALEINSSAIRRGYPELHPSDTICELYVKNGGSRVTPGSDSHRREQVGSNFDLINEKIAEFKLQPVYFSKRQAIEIDRSKG
jgi:histidinol-phosphatase (PHP family)